MNDLNIKKMITYKHLERLFTSQEYFVWNSNVNNAINELEEESEEASENSLWEIFSDYDLEELEDYKFVEIIKNGFNHVNKLFIKQIQEQANREGKKVAIIKEKTNDLSFNKTIQLLKDKNIDWIINPIFIYDDLIARPALYKKENKHLYSIVHGSKTKLKFYIKAYFEYNVLKKIGVDINKYSFYTYDNTKDYIESKDLSFVSSEYCWTQKSGPSKQTKSTIEENCENNTIIEKLKSGIIKTKKDRITGEVKVEINLNLNDFDTFIEQIRNAKKINLFFSLNRKDKTVWGDNPNFVNLFDYEKYKLKKVSGSLLNKEELLDIMYGTTDIYKLMKNKKSLSYVMHEKNNFETNKMIEVVNTIKNSKCVWYDFEGISMPYVMLPHTKPYQQLIFQVSIIRTNNENEIYKNNIVIDPQKISINDFMEMIDEIYWQEAEWYIVYNKSYELNKLNEMFDLFVKSNVDPAIFMGYLEKIKIIEEKTIDLLDLFKITSSKEKIPPIFLHELLGYSSIKKIEKYITENKIQLKQMIKPYKELNVQNGLMAMNKGIQRYLNSIGDNEWEKEAKHLAEYCENDVRAMIMVFYFIEWLIQGIRKVSH